MRFITEVKPSIHRTMPTNINKRKIQKNTSSAISAGFGLRHCPAPSGVLPPDIAMGDAMEALADDIPTFGFHDI